MSLQWGDVPAWIALVIAAGAIVHAERSRRDAKASERASELARARADEAKAGADSLEVSLQAIADTLAANLRTREAGEEPRPTIDFKVEFRGGSVYALRNVGNSEATGITVDSAGLPITRMLPKGEHLDPFQAVQFLVSPVLGKPVPPDILVTCDQWEKPQRLPMPPRI